MGWGVPWPSGGKVSEQMNNEPLLNPEHFREDQRKIVGAIEKLRYDPRNGEPYEGSSEKAGRHFIKADTGPILTLLTAQAAPEHVISLGTAYGFGDLYALLGAPKAHLTTYEFNPDVAREAQEIFDNAEVSAQVVPGKIPENIDLLAGKPPAGILIIDHNKGDYLPDFLGILPYLAPGATVAADNVNDRRLETSDFVEYMYDHYKPTIYPTQAGLLVAQV